MKMIDLSNKIIGFALGIAMLGASVVAGAAESTDKKEAANVSAAEKLVAAKSSTTPAASIDPTADKPMTINFSDFVKDGAGCGVPNLDTSAK